MLHSSLLCRLSQLPKAFKDHGPLIPVPGPLVRYLLLRTALPFPWQPPQTRCPPLHCDTSVLWTLPTSAIFHRPIHLQPPLLSALFPRLSLLIMIISITSLLLSRLPSRLGGEGLGRLILHQIITLWAFLFLLSHSLRSANRRTYRVLSTHRFCIIIQL